jgi:hypothetical protein
VAGRLIGWTVAGRLIGWTVGGRPDRRLEARTYAWVYSGTLAAGCRVGGAAPGPNGVGAIGCVPRQEMTKFY